MEIRLIHTDKWPVSDAVSFPIARGLFNSVIGFIISLFVASKSLRPLPSADRQPTALSSAQIVPEERHTLCSLSSRLD